MGTPLISESPPQGQRAFQLLWLLWEGTCVMGRWKRPPGSGLRAPGSEQLLPVTRPRRAEGAHFPGLSLESWDGAPYNCRVDASPDQ